MKKVIKIPDGYENIVKAYSLPPEDIKEREEWERDNLSYVYFPWGAVRLSWGGSTTRFLMHKKVAPHVQEVMNYLHSSSYYVLIRTFGGAYFYRMIRGTVDRLSTHAFGIALDFNPEDNELGQVPRQPYLLVKIFYDFGFVWGGTWSRPDGMHWQLCDGY